MIDSDKLIRLYNTFLGEEELTTRMLNEYGFSAKNIDELIQRGIIERVKRGFYRVSSANDLYMYGISLINDKEYEKARIFFEKCLEIDKTHIGASFHVFIDSVQRKDYERSFELLDVLIKKGNPLYKNDYNYYLYLLSVIANPPQEQRQYAQHLTINDIKVNVTDTKYENVSAKNKIRVSAFQKKFSYALQQLRCLTMQQGKFTQQDKIEKELLREASNHENMSRQHLSELLRNREFQKVIDYLLEKQEREKINKLEECILSLTRFYVETKETKKIPNIKALNARNVFEAIDNNNFSLALNLTIEYNENMQVQNENSVLYLILNEICTLINELLKEKNSVMLEETKNQTIKSNEDKPTSDLLASIYLNLWKNEYEKAYRSLSEYMSIMDKSVYEPLIKDLIEISKLENDTAFVKPMTALSMINRGEYSFSIANYIQLFYVSLSKNKIDVSKLYLDFIKKLSKLENSDIEIDRLYRILELTEESLKSEKETIKPEIQTAEIKQNHNFISPKQNETNSFVPSNDDKIFIQKKYEELMEQKGIILLKPMSQQRINSIIEISKSYADMVAFVIGGESDKRIVLRYKPLAREPVDIRNTIYLAIDAYKNGNYNEAIKNNLLLLQTFNRAKTKLYVALGLAYLKNSNIDLAIDYLTIATIKSKKEDGKYDFSDLIDRLKKKTMEQEEEEKPNFRMSLDEFEDIDILSLFDITNFEEIDTIVSGSDYDVESVCTLLGMNEEQTDAIKLYYAKAFYSQGDFEQGDLFVRAVEFKRKKTFKVWEILEEIKKNKKFYQYRQSEPVKQIKLSILPNKK